MFIKGASLHSQRIFRNALQRYTLFYFCAIPIYMDFYLFICQIDRKHRHFVRNQSSAQALNGVLQKN